MKMANMASLSLSPYNSIQIDRKEEKNQTMEILEAVQSHI